VGVGARSGAAGSQSTALEGRAPRPVIVALGFPWDRVETRPPSEFASGRRLKALFDPQKKKRDTCHRVTWHRGPCALGKKKGYMETDFQGDRAS